MATTTKCGEGPTSVLGDESPQETTKSFEVADDDSDDVMAGILDDIDGDGDDNEDTSMKFIPTALSPVTTNKRPQQQMGSNEPRNEKDIDRLLLMVKYPNAGQEEIKEVLKIKETHQHAAAIAASRKGQLFREQRQHEDAEHWRKQREKEQLKQRELQKQQQQQQKEEEQQQDNSSRSSVNSQKDSTSFRATFENNDEEKGQNFSHDTATKREGNPRNSVGQATGDLPRRSLEETNDEAESDNTIIWQAAMDDGEPVSFESNADEIRNQDDDTSLMRSNGNKEEELHHYPKESEKTQHASKSIVQQTRKSLSKVFGGASKILGNVLPLAAADGNAPQARDYYTDSTGDAISVNTENGVDSRSLASSKISNPTSQASAITYKMSNIRSLNPMTRNEFENDVESDQCPINRCNNNDADDPNEQENNRKGWHGDQTIREWILDRKKNKFLILLFSLIIVVAVIFTTLAAVYGARRRDERNASKSSGISSPSPSSGGNINDKDNVTTTINPEDNATEVPTLDIAYDDNIETSPPLVSISTFTENPIEINNPLSMPTVMPTILPTVAPSLSEIQISATLSQNTYSPTNFPTVQTIPTQNPTEFTFLNWSWSDDAEDGSVLKGVPTTDEHFGETVALSADGQTLVVGAPDAFDKLGIVRIYEQKGGVWVSTNSLLGRNKGDEFGKAIALSADGRVLAIAAPMYNGSAGDKSGIVRTFVYSPFGYVPMGQDIEGEDATDQLGTCIALSHDGRRLAVGAPYHDNSDETPNDDGKNSGSSDDVDRLVSGTARVLEWSVEEQEWVTIDNGGGGTPFIGSTHRDLFGWSIDLNDDGSLLCVGAPRDSGYVQCFEEEERNDNMSSKNSAARQWKQVGDIIRNEDGILRHDDNFGAFIRVGRDSTGTRHRVAIGAHGKNSRKALDTGHVVVYEFNPSTAARGWIRLGRKVITSETPGEDFRMGFSFDMHEDLLTVGIPGANGGIGKVEVFEFQRDSWEWLRNPTIFHGSATGSLGYGTAISITPRGDFVVGSPESNDNVGSVRFYLRNRLDQ